MMYLFVGQFENVEPYIAKFRSRRENCFVESAMDAVKHLAESRFDCCVLTDDKGRSDFVPMIPQVIQKDIYVLFTKTPEHSNVAELLKSHKVRAVFRRPDEVVEMIKYLDNEFLV